MGKFNVMSMLSVAGLLLISAPSFADDDDVNEKHEGTGAVVQELFGSEQPYNQDQYELQIGLNGNYASVAEESAFEMPLAVEFGITDWWQVGVEMPFRLTEGKSEELVGFGTQFNLINGKGFEGDHSFVLSVGAEMALPREEGEFASYEPVVSAQYGVKPVYFNLAVGYEMQKVAGEEGAEAEMEGETTVTPGFVFALGEFRPSLELPIGLGDETVMHLIPGITWKPEAYNLEVGVGYIAAISGVENAPTALRMNLSYEFDL